MKISVLRLVILVASLIVCAGCGSAFYSHEIDVVVEPEPGGMPATGFKVGKTDLFRREDIGKLQLQSVDSNGLVRFDHRELSVLWVWQRRPAYVSFGLFIPSVSTNGYFWIRFDEASMLPWRGLKQGKVDIRPRYFEFDRSKGWRTLPVVHTDVMPSTLGGYHIELHLPIRALRDGMAAEFVPYEP